MKKSRKLSDAEVFALAAEYELLKQKEGQAKKDAKEISDKIIADLDRRGTKSLGTSSIQVTKVQVKGMVYDADNLWHDLKPSQRRMCYQEILDINALPGPIRKSVIGALGKFRKKYRKVVLDVTALSSAVQTNKIPAKIVNKHSEIKTNAPYVTVSHGTGG